MCGQNSKHAHVGTHKLSGNVGRKTEILAVLGTYSLTDPQWLAQHLGIPRASVRREVRELREAGYPICHAVAGQYPGYGRYMLMR